MSRVLTFMLLFLCFLAPLPAQTGSDGGEPGLGVWQPTYPDRTPVSLEGVEDIEAYLTRRRLKIWPKLKAYYHDIAQDGKQIEGMYVMGRMLYVEGRVHPELIPIEYCLFSYSLHYNYNPGTLKSIIIRGFPPNETQVLVDYSSFEYDFHRFKNDSKNSFLKTDQIQNGYLKKTDWTNKEIVEYIRYSEALSNLIDVDWAVNILSRISTRGRRVLISFLYETEIPAATKGFLIGNPTPQQIIECRGYLKAIQRQEP